MIHIPTAPWAHIMFDLLARSSGLAIGLSLDRWRLRGVKRFCLLPAEGAGRSITA